MRNLAASIKFIYFIICALLYGIVGLPCTLLIDFFPIKCRKFLIRNIRFSTLLVSKIFGIKIKVTGEAQYLNDNKNRLIVGNHQSYLDVLILSCLKPACYVTSVEMKNAIGIGQLAKLGGCVFVERRNKVNIKNEIQEITQALQGGLDIVIFPEATSTNGEQVLRFRKPLLNAAIFAESEILPLSINYLKINQQKVTTKNRDLVCWYADMEFLPHFWNFLKCRGFEIEVRVSSPLKIGPTDDAGELAERTHRIVSSIYTPITTP